MRLLLLLILLLLLLLLKMMQVLVRNIIQTFRNWRWRKVLDILALEKQRQLFYI